MDTFADRFRRHLARTRLSQTELADLLGCDTAAVRAAAHGRAVPTSGLAQIYSWVAMEDRRHPYRPPDEA